MDGITLRRASVLCTLLLWTFQDCHGAVTVTVPAKVEALKGDLAKLPCSFNIVPASPNTMVEWFIQEELGNRKRVAFRSESSEQETDADTPLSGRVSIDETFALNINPVQPLDEQVYFCQVTAGAAGVGDASTTLKVFFAPEKPELTSPASQSIFVGGTSSSEIGKCVTMNGHPMPRIIWYKDEQPLPEIKDRQEKTYMVPAQVKEASGLFTIMSTLYMQPTKADKDSVFHCVVEYMMPGEQIKQKKSDTIKINLNYPSETATFVLVNTDPVKEGDAVTMKCETDGNPQPEFDFYKDDKAIKGQDGLLVLKSVKRTDSGVYKCQGLDYDNLDADLTGTVALTVNYVDPVSVTPDQAQVVMLGDKVEWQCKTKASAAHTVHWMKGSEVLSQDGTLSLQEVKYENVGEYKCVGAVPSVPGLTSEASVNLTVKGAPMIVAPAPGEVSKEGDMVKLKCAAYGLPAPQFTWQPSGKESVSMEGHMTVSTLSLQATADILSKGVSCEVTNEHGSDRKSVPVSLKRAIENSADRGRAFSLLALLSSLLLSGLFVVQTL